MFSMSWQFLHFRTKFSLLQGVFSPSAICRFAAARHKSCVGIADVNNFYGLPELLQQAAQYQLKAIAGTAVYWQERHFFSLYPLSRQAYGQVCGFLSRLLSAQKNEEDFSPLRELLRLDCSDLWIISRDKIILSFLQEEFSKCRPPGARLLAGLFYGEAFRPLALWASAQKIDLIALNDALYSTFQQKQCLYLLEALRQNSSVQRLKNFSLGEGAVLTKEQAALSVFSAFPEALRNAEALAEAADARIFLSQTFVFPSFKGMDRRCAFVHLKRLCLQGISRRYKRDNPAVRKRLAYELDIIRKKNFASYFLVVHDIVQQCPRTCGRGSSAASIVSYLLGITHVDPLAYNLYFERFLNPGRKDPPDIDVDFPWDERDKTLNYVFSRYAGQAAMVADHVTFARRAAIREAGRALGRNTAQLEYYADLVAQCRDKDLPADLQEAASLLRGLPHFIGCHPGGVVITPGKITDYAHIQPGLDGRPILAWEKDGTEDAGLVKIDLLGNRSLAVLRDCLNQLEKDLPHPPSWESFNPLGDPKAEDLLKIGNSMGIFYIESPATRQLLKKMRSSSFEKMVAASSLIRPAAHAYINDYVARMHGASWQSFPREVEDVLAENYGIMIYQEDVSRVAIAAAGFSASEADLVRKLLNRKAGKARLIMLKKRFFEGCRAKSYSEKTIEKLWAMISSFEGYSFCKAHSASYALLSMRLAWMKAHYPLLFMSCVINNGGGFYSRQVYLNEVRRLGFSLAGPHINQSSAQYSRDGSCLRAGFLQIRDLSKNCIHRILQHRENSGQFKDFFSFLKEIQPDIRDLRALVRSGTLDPIRGKLCRPAMLWYAYMKEKQPLLFEGASVPPVIREYDRRRMIEDELLYLNLFISCFPLDLFKQAQRQLLQAGNFPPCIPSSRLPQYKGKKISFSGTLVSVKPLRTKGKKFMAFVSFEDEQGGIEAIFFPRAWEKAAALLYENYAFLICGKVCEEMGSFSLDVEQIFPLHSEHFDRCSFRP